MARRDEQGETTIDVLPGGDIEIEGHNYEGADCQSAPLLRILKSMEGVEITDSKRKPDAYRKDRAQTGTRERTRGQ